MVEGKSFKINLMKDMGELSSKKIDKLAETLLPEYPQKAAQPFGWVFFNPDKKKTVLLTPNQLTLSYDSNNLPPEEDELVRIMDAIMETLLIDDGFEVIYKFCAHRPSNLDSLINSLDSFKEDNLRLDGLNGVAYRFFINRENQRGDFKVEPFLLDYKKVFLELEIQETDRIESKVAIANSLELYNEFMTSMAEFSERFF